ncbi:unnamed protein product [Heterosigma akashiwo]
MLRLCCRFVFYTSIPLLLLLLLLLASLLLLLLHTPAILTLIHDRVSFLRSTSFGIFI